jgi:hypothetical protein
MEPLKLSAAFGASLPLVGFASPANSEPFRAFTDDDEEPLEQTRNP